MDAYDWVGKGPKAMRVRLLSLRAHDAAGWMIDADVVEGQDVEPVVARLLAGPAVAQLHAHNARRGCHAGRVERASEAAQKS